MRSNLVMPYMFLAAKYAGPSGEQMVVIHMTRNRSIPILLVWVSTHRTRMKPYRMASLSVHTENRRTPILHAFKSTGSSCRYTALLMPSSG